ncbi:hypothetical protein NPIL_264431 [Nephila pilipes]|uniref:Uncharacterized protein n=1 Tax=Nephila pilipes TaxID=299642 RepID=A0A8X6Q3V1_NEPPI|nr:hypothetical protein NPIL_264431 [Nephila pilipes]
MVCIYESHGEAEKGLKHDFLRDGCVRMKTTRNVSMVDRLDEKETDHGKMQWPERHFSMRDLRSHTPAHYSSAKKPVALKGSVDV